MATVPVDRGLAELEGIRPGGSFTSFRNEGPFQVGAGGTVEYRQRCTSC